MDHGRPRRPRPAVHALPLRYLLVVPVSLAVLTAAALFVRARGDSHLAMLNSQCRARARVPWLSRQPLLGGPACFVVSFFLEAAGVGVDVDPGASLPGEAVPPPSSSLRAAAAMAVVLAAVAALLTVTAVESARVCNAPSRLLACPTPSWLLFAPATGGAFVWQLVVVPAFLRRSRAILAARRRGGPPALSGPADPVFGEAMRHLSAAAESVAIPAAVAAGYFAPPALALTLLGDDPAAAAAAAVLAWLFFPVWVSLARRVVRALVLAAAAALRRSDRWRATLHLESSRPALVAVYAVPVVCSALAHGLLVWSLAQPDDRGETTRSALDLVAIHAFFLALTVLYWVLVEAGSRVALVVVAVSVVLGPGAGICVGWVRRERAVDLDRTVTVVAVGARRDSEDGGVQSEVTPLLR